MAKKANEIPQDQNIVQTTMEEVLHDSMIPYAEHVIMERALPRVEDGLKPVQRRILFTMNELGITPDKPHRKCARIVGDCLGKYHPHGDSSVYDALVRMAQDFSLRDKLVDGHGNFGSIDGDGAAAMRYTEARMAPLAMEMLRDIEKDTVPFRLNFDDTLKEPDMLPARFPNLLVNGASGIAVGLATNIPPHNLGECVKAISALMENPDMTTEELMAFIPGPDFPTGGIVLDTPEIRAAYETGRGKLTVRSRVHMEDGPSGRTMLVITEVPYGVNKAAMLEKILHLSEEKKSCLGNIYDIRDESDRTGLRAVIEVRKEADPAKVLAALYKYSDLQVTFGVNMVAIADGKPKQLGLKSLMEYFIRHQKNVVTARTKYDLDKAMSRAHILQGLMIAVDNLDEVIALIRSSKSVRDAREALMERFTLTEVQAQAILDMRLQRLTGLEILSLEKEYHDVLKEIDRLNGILKSEKKLLQVIAKELGEIGEKYDTPRRTTIRKEENVDYVEESEAPEAEDAVVVYTRGGQLKRFAPKAWQKNAAEGDDAARYAFSTNTDGSLLIFTNLGSCYTLNVGTLPELTRSNARGSFLSGVLKELAQGETCVAMFCVAPNQLKDMPDFAFITGNGQIKRTAAGEYDVRRQKIVAITLKDNDRLASVLPISGGDDLLLITKNAMSIRFALKDVPQLGRSAAGVRGMAVDDDDEVILAMQTTAMNQVLLLTQNGWGKRIMSMDFERQSRAGKGVRCFPLVKGVTLAAALAVTRPGCTVTLYQKIAAPTTLTMEEFKVAPKADKGRMAVLALMGDIVLEASINENN